MEGDIGFDPLLFDRFLLQSHSKHTNPFLVRELPRAPQSLLGTECLLSLPSGLNPTPSNLGWPLLGAMFIVKMTF